MALVQEIETNLSAARSRAEEINAEEERLGWSLTTFTQLNDAEEMLGPFAKLWKTADLFSKSFRKWTNGSVYKLDGEQVQKDVDDMWRVNFKLVKTLTAQGAMPAVAVAEKVKAKLEEFRKNIPLICAVSNDGLRERKKQPIIIHNTTY